MKGLITIFGVFVLFESVLCGLYEKRLLKYLFDPTRPDAHNPIERPSANDTETLNVSVKFFLNQVMDVDEKNQVLTTIIWMDLTWNDYHFLWNPKNFGNITTLILPYTAVWRPDILLYNCADEKFDRLFPTNTVINHNGTVQWLPPGLFKSTCNIDILWFPFDEQKCEMKFGSWTYNGDQLNFQLQCINASQPNCTEVGTVDLSEYSNNGEFHLRGASVRRYAQRYECCDYDFIDVKIFIRLQRRALYYVFNLIVPCLLISGMALMVFMLPPDAGEKISLGVTILLSLTMFLQLVADKLPQTSEAIPLIGIYFSCTMIMCSLSIVFTVLVLNYHHRSADIIAVPPWIRNIVNTYLARLMCMEPPKRSQIIEVEDISSSDSGGDSSIENLLNKKPQCEQYIGVEQTYSNWNPEGGKIPKPIIPPNSSQIRMNGNVKSTLLLEAGGAGGIDSLQNGPQERVSKSLMANVLNLDDDFRATAPYSVPINLTEKQTAGNNLKSKNSTELSPTMASSNQPPPPYRLYNAAGTNLNSEPLRDPFSDEFSDISTNNNIPIQNNSPGANQSASGQSQFETIYKADLEFIITELRFITKKLRDDEQESLVSLEWKFAARVIDRFCLVIFSVFNIVATFAILCSAPNLVASFMP
ncbi:unnamed protein product [Trichobilharzia szidati]|nr:unnamed protein product [Trichobilharzia szidati]